MPQIYKDNKFRQRRRAGLRKRRFRKVVAKAPRIAKVAKYVARKEIGRALTRNLENKTRTIRYYTLSVRGATIYGINPTYWLPQAISEADRVGDRIMNVRFRLNGTYHHRGVSLTNANYYAASKLRVVGAWVNTKWSHGSVS